MMYRTLPMAPAGFYLETATHIEVPWPHVTRICGEPYGFDPTRDPCDWALAAQQDSLVYAALHAATGYPWLNPAGPCPANAGFNSEGWWVAKPKRR